MALDKDVMAGLIADKLEAAGIITTVNKPAVVLIWKEVCDGIISHLKVSGVVSTAVTGTADLGTGEVTGTGAGSIE
jgi:hypothetical protein